jgi:Xaa-Pro aminopeptidase
MRILRDRKAVQAIAKAVLDELGPTIRLDDSERSIAERAQELMAERGVAETWYYACPAFVLLGSRSCLSLSGRDYKPSSEPVGSLNLVTVDLSPLKEGVWGDCARSFVIEDGRYVECPANAAFRRGVEVERSLHEAMCSYVTPATTFEDLFFFANSEIQRHGFENLDFLGNLGHSIESGREARCYIERGNKVALGDVDLFTFEPHIRERGGSWGFKHENIYYFNRERRAVEL